MKEIDTESSVIWPSWCYSDKVCNVLRKCSNSGTDFDVNTGGESSDTLVGKNQHKINCNKIRKTPPLPPALTPHLIKTTRIGGEKKMLSERSLVLSGYINNNTESGKTNCNTPPLAGFPLPSQGADQTVATPTTTAAAAAAYLYLEKVKNERTSPRVTVAQLDSLKDAIMESSAAAAVAAAMVKSNNTASINNNNNSNHSNHNSSAINCSTSINNNLVNSQVRNQVANSSSNNTNDELHSLSLTQSCSQQQHQIQKQPQHQQLSLHVNSNYVKRERLSPGTNGDLQTSLSRSRSTTPSSFRGTSPPNSVHSSPSDSLIPMHNLSTNLLNSIHQAASSSRHANLSVSTSGISSASSGLPTDFSTRNYSDFMRSLAAKYNNTNPNDNLKRNALFETTTNNTTVQKKTSTVAQKTSYAISPSTPLNIKDVTITTTSSLHPPSPITSVAILPGESTIKLSQQNKFAAAVANAGAACSSNVSPYMSTLLSSLPFSTGIFPPLIDMSSTQALITLARAAKENEIHNILSDSSQHRKISATSTSPSPRTSLNIALQQAAQFISPALIYSAQLQKQHLQHAQVNRQPSPHLANISNSTTSSTTSGKGSENLGEKVNISPLDLSSQPPAAKRFKAESTSSQSSSDGLMHITITRRASSSTATMSPSPPPLNEKSLQASAFADPSSKSEETITAFTPIKVVSSTSATVTQRQCQAQSDELSSWTVDDVCAFVGSIDICTEYVKHFRDQCIDGSGLPLLTEDHLVNSLGMKLGPALKLRSLLAKKLGGPCPCASCVAQVQQVFALQTSGIATATTTTALTTDTNTTNMSAIDSNPESSDSSSNQLPKNSLTINSSINSAVNKHEITTTTCCINKNSSNNTTTNSCNSDATTRNRPRSNSKSNTKVEFSSTPVLPLQQEQQQESTIQSMCNSCTPATKRHDNADSSSI